MLTKTGVVLLNYTQALNYLIKTYNHDASRGLERTSALLRKLGHPQKKLSVIHVAGTNGKGSVCAFLSAVLQAEGYKVGVFTSPHLLRVNERLSVNTISISDDDFAAVLTRVVNAAEAVGDRAPFFFELLTVMAFDYFAHSGVDFAIMETGIGGRLDSTNAVDSPVLSVITAIGYDHMELLGHTLAQIASEKAGIIKEGCPVAVYPTETISVFKAVARQKNAKLYYTGEPSVSLEAAFSLSKTKFNAKTEYYDYQSLSISLLGRQQIQNASHALLCVKALRDAGITIADDAVYTGLSEARWPGRFTLLPGKPVTVLDGAHNEDGALCFKHNLAQYFPGKRIVLVAGLLKTKDSQAMMRHLTQNIHAVICTQPQAPKALPAEALAASWASLTQPVTVEPDVKKALPMAAEAAGTDGVVAVAGSLYLVGEAYGYYKGNEEKP